MFGRKKNDGGNQPPKRKGAALMNQMGMGGLAGLEDELYGDVENDEELEAELQALQGQPAKPKPKGRVKVNAAEFDQMIVESMKDLEDEEVSDTEDPDLLSELAELAGEEEEEQEEKPAAPSSGSSTGGAGLVNMLEDRLTNYTQAADSARAVGDTSKVRRLDRGLKTIQDLLKKAKAGRAVDEDDIPPPVAITKARPQPKPEDSGPPPMFEPTILTVAPPAAPVPAPRGRAPPPPLTPAHVPAEPSTSTAGAPSAQDQENINLLMTRRNQYKASALSAKKSGDVTTATKYVRIAKQFDMVISALEQGNPVDLSQMPPPPPGYGGSPAEPSRQSLNPAPSEPSVKRSSMQATGDEDKPEAGSASAPAVPSAPASVLEALQQRLQFYEAEETKAKEANNSSKARRLGRVAKQYKDAIRAEKAGKPIDPELPDPPGYPPIPTSSAPAPIQAQSLPPSSQPVRSEESLQPPARPQGRRSPSPQAAERSAHAPQAAQRSPQPQQPSPSGQKLPTQQRRTLKRSSTSRAEQQANFLRERMQEYKMAAINAKRNNDVELAKKYLRLAKGFEPMIEATESGLPVDLTQVPPSLDTSGEDPSYVIVEAEDCQPTGDRKEVFKKLESNLIAQIRTCSTNSSHFTKLGDVVSATKFQKMEAGLRKDLDALKNAFRHQDPVPKFHYENKTFSMVQCNTDLGDSDMEMMFVRGIQYNPPSGYQEKDLDTYIKFEFPYPTDEPQVGQSETVKGSLNPEYQEPVKLQINRKSRALARVIERKGIKLEIYYKRGFLKSDKVLGTVNVKLTPLETQCTLHDSFDLTDGRKSVGGKLEVKIRIRDPFKSKQVEEVKEKWLVIDQFVRVSLKGAGPGTSDTRKGIQSSTTCMEVLKFEKQQLDKQIASLRDSLSESQLHALQSKSKLLQDKFDEQQKELKEGGMEAWKDYVSKVEQEIQAYTDEGRHLAKQGDMQKAQLMLSKKKLAEKEVAAIRTKIPNV